MLNKILLSIIGLFLLVFSICLPMKVCAENMEFDVLRPEIVSVSITDIGVEKVEYSIQKVNNLFSPNNKLNNQQMYHIVLGGDILIAEIKDENFIIYSRNLEKLTDDKQREIMYHFVKILQNVNNVDDDKVYKFVNNIAEQNTIVGDAVLPAIIKGQYFKYSLIDNFKINLLVIVNRVIEIFK